MDTNNVCNASFNYCSNIRIISRSYSNTCKRYIHAFTPAGKEIWAGIGQGIADGWNKFANDIKNAFNKIIDKFKEIFGIHSPSTVFAGFGGMIMEGLKNGITGANIWDGIKSNVHNYR